MNEMRKHSTSGRCSYRMVDHLREKVVLAPRRAHEFRNVFGDLPCTRRCACDHPTARTSAVQISHTCTRRWLRAFSSSIYRNARCRAPARCARSFCAAGVLAPFLRTSVPLRCECMSCRRRAVLKLTAERCRFRGSACLANCAIASTRCTTCPASSTWTVRPRSPPRVPPPPPCC